MKTLTLLLFLLSSLTQAQVGIGTEKPKATLDVAGNLRIEKTDIVEQALYVYVEGQDSIVHKMLLSSLVSSSCPNLIRSQSNPYYLKFESYSSIPNPQNNLIIQGFTFVSAGTWVENNKYIFSYSNTNGQSLNISDFIVNFSGLTCRYY